MKIFPWIQLLFQSNFLCLLPQLDLNPWKEVNKQKAAQAEVPRTKVMKMTETKRKTDGGREKREDVTKNTNTVMVMTR